MASFKMGSIKAMERSPGLMVTCLKGNGRKGSDTEKGSKSMEMGTGLSVSSKMVHSTALGRTIGNLASRLLVFYFSHGQAMKANGATGKNLGKERKRGETAAITMASFRMVFNMEGESLSRQRRICETAVSFFLTPRYVGEWAKGERHGTGIWRSSSGETYRGGFLTGSETGKVCSCRIVLKS